MQVLGMKKLTAVKNHSTSCLLFVHSHLLLLLSYQPYTVSAYTFFFQIAINMRLPCSTHSSCVNKLEN
jgi:hypothetical protein